MIWIKIMIDSFIFSEKIVNLNILRRSFIQLLSTFKKNHEKIRFFNVIYGSKYSLGQLLLKHAKEDKTQKTFERKKMCMEHTLCTMPSVLVLPLQKNSGNRTHYILPHRTCSSVWRIFYAYKKLTRGNCNSLSLSFGNIVCALSTLFYHKTHKHTHTYEFILIFRWMSLKIVGRQIMCLTAAWNAFFNPFEWINEWMFVRTAVMFRWTKQKTNNNNKEIHTKNFFEHFN